MSYQLSIILGTTISLRKFRRPLFSRYLPGPPSVFPVMATFPYFKGESGVSRRKEKQGEPGECPDSAPSIIFTREGARRGGRICLFVRTSFPRMPLGHLHRQRRRYDSPEGVRSGRRRLRGDEEVSKKSRIIGITLIALA